MPEAPRILHLYTLYFPQGTHEAFIEPELPYLCQAFDEVKIFPQMKTGEENRSIPVNASVIHLGGGVKSDSISRLKFMGANLMKYSFIKKLRYQYGHAGQILQRAKRLSNHIGSSSEVVHYSYWFDEWASVLGQLSKDNRIKGYVSRAHGFDLYDYRQDIGYHVNRSIQLNGLMKLFPVSDFGSSYLAARLPKANIATAHLGTVDHGPGLVPTAKGMYILSVARAVSLKRLDRILSVLSLCKENVCWTHIGDGPDLEHLRTKAESMPKHIDCQFLGNMSHGEVMSYYLENGVHLLISLSESEGLPVSMMESLSFGVPVLSTDVGGVSELVNEDTGKLLEKDAEDVDIAGVIDDWNLTGKCTVQYREGVRYAWKKKFSAGHNYQLFIKEVKALYT